MFATLTMKHPFLVISLTLTLTAFTGLHAQDGEYLPGDLIVMLAPGGDARAIAADLRTLDGRSTGLQVVKELSAPMRAWLLHFDHGAIAQPLMLRAISSHPQVMLAQNNHVVHDRIVPNDTDFGSQWQHVEPGDHDIDSDLAWDITTGGLTATGDTIVVCVIENADLPHEDLIDNAWFNHQEIPNNGADDDGNGYTDDFQGWNPGGNDDDVYGGGHGTSVAGMIGATGDNGIGVAGANWNVKIMVVTRDGVSEAAVVESYTYPLIMRRLYNDSGGAQGAFVVATNASWGIDGADHTLYPIWCAMYDTLGTEGILNCGATANNNVDIDVVDDMPTGCESDFMVSVTATNDSDMRTFSAWGATTIDVGAPGDQIYTTEIGDNYGSTGGTSFASPLTAGVIGLLYSAPCAAMMTLVHADPMAGALYVRQALFTGVDQVGNLPGNTVTGGRINSYNSLVWIMDNCGACPAAYNLGATNTGLGTADLIWSSPTGTVFNIQYHAVGDTTWTVVNGATSPYTLSNLLACTDYEFEVEVVCDSISSGWSLPFTFTSEGCCTAPAGLAINTINATSAAAIWDPVLVATTYNVQYAEAGSGSWTVITGLGAPGYNFLGLDSCTTYEAQVQTDCGGTLTDWSASAVFNTTGCGDCADLSYCPSVSANASEEWIESVELNTLNNVSGNNSGYGDFTGMSTPLNAGSPQDITLTPGYAGNVYDEYFTVWMDLDHDGDFISAGELLYTSPVATAAVTGSITVPLTAQPGITRMRIIMVFFAPAGTGCDDGYPYGETEDYCVDLSVNIGVNETAPGTPVQVHPDPADRELFFTMDGLAGECEVQLLDNGGRIVLRDRIDGRQAAVDVASLAEGLYVWRVMADGKEAARGKVVVEH